MDLGEEQMMGVKKGELGFCLRLHAAFDFILRGQGAHQELQRGLCVLQSLVARAWCWEEQALRDFEAATGILARSNSG